MIITCPHCQTKYQVTYEAIGAVGRKVQCAHCQQAWQQRPLDSHAEPPADAEAVAAMREDAMDEAMAAEARAAAAETTRQALAGSIEREEAAPGKVDPAVIRMRQRAFTRRQSAMAGTMPLARFRRLARVLGVTLLATIVAGSYFGRVQLVERFPALAGVYAAVGLGVNVVGLDFSNVTTLQTLRDGKEVLIVSAQIVGLMPTPAHVPAVVVTLLDSHGAGIYEWSVTPSVRDLMAGERATFDTQITVPPGEAHQVRLSFATGAAPREPEAAPSVAAAEPHAPVGAAQAHAPTEAHGPAEPATHTEAEPAAHAPAATPDHAEPAAPAADPDHPAPEHH